MEANDFLERVFKHVPEGNTRELFEHWPVHGRATEKAVAMVPIPGADPDKLMARIMDVDHYRGNVDHVAECRAIPDPDYVMPEKVRFYQRVEIPLLGAVHHELVLVNAGFMSGFQVAYWYMLKDKTEALPKRRAARSDYNVGAWILGPGIVGYALSSAPKRSDVNILKWKALTKGADIAAQNVIKANVKGMARWASRR